LRIVKNFGVLHSFGVLLRPTYRFALGGAEWRMESHG
jgi:hypothetical protein